MSDDTRQNENGESSSKPTDFFNRIRGGTRRLIELEQDAIWSPLEGKSAATRLLYGVLRVTSLCVNGIRQNRLASHAGALSYHTLVAVGPFLAVIIMVSGFVLGENQKDDIAGRMTELIYQLAPPLEIAAQEAEAQSEADTGPPEQGAADNAADTDPLPDIETAIDMLVQNARSGALGIVGSVVLIFVSVMLLSTIERTFNTIWGINRNRSMANRIVFYWSFISLGAILGILAITFTTVSRLAQTMRDLPLGSWLSGQAVWMAPILAFASVVILLALFYRNIPNTHVAWKPAFLGAAIVAGLLYLNQELSFIYVGKVVQQRSLLGALGILPVILFSLFIFWLLLLLGGQLTFAIQNVNTLTNQRAWENISPRTQETLSLAALVFIARRFHQCQPPPTANEISDKLRTPNNLVNLSLNRLGELGFVSTLESQDEYKAPTYRYQPARPLNSITFGDLREAIQTAGNNHGTELIVHHDPLIAHYRSLLIDFCQQDTLSRPLSELLDEDGVTSEKTP